MTVGGNINNKPLEGATGGLLNIGNDEKLSISGALEMVPPSDMWGIFKQLRGVLSAPIYWGLIKTHNETHKNGFQLSDGDFDLKGEVRCATLFFL